MQVRFYNFPQELASNFAQQIKLFYAKINFLDVVYISEDSTGNRDKLRNVLQKTKRPTILVSADQKFAELAWKLNIDHFILLQKPLYSESYKEIQKGIQLCLTRNEFYLKKIAVNSQEGMHSISLKDIAYILADGSYTKIITNKNEILVSKNLRYFEDSLCELPNFHRFGRSLIVNLNQVSSVVNRQVQFENGVTVSFPKSGNSFKELKELLLWKK